MFGFPRLQALVSEHGEEQALGNFLLEELYSFNGEGWEQGGGRHHPPYAGALSDMTWMRAASLPVDP